MQITLRDQQTRKYRQRFERLRGLLQMKTDRMNPG